MPQDPESEAELRNLAAVPYQIVSPGNNTTIIGIFQDSMLGSYQFTRENVVFTPREAMNLLMMFDGVNEHELLKKGEKITSFDIMSQIMPPLSLKYKTKQFKETDDAKTSNNVLEIRNGTYIRGQMDKGVLGGGTKGLLHRTCNDYGNFASAKFIDDLQNVVTEYMKSAAFSVGISDLISNDSTNQAIIKIINEKKNDVKNLIDQTQIGVFENNTGKTNQEEFETQVNNILNQATSESGKVGLKSLDKNNRFVTMVNAGSKGSDLNISFMISCLGQQNVDGKRIPYGFEHRTLPHFTKYDDSPSARGFVESSYINGLSPQELFFHAMGGRVGLIDTAVKTSTTGYIQRRLIKGLEDLMVNYDMTVRSNKNKIVQFRYGEDNIDTTKVENQPLPIVSMSIQDIYAHYALPDDKNKMVSNILTKDALKKFKKEQDKTNEYCKKYIEYMIQQRKEIVEHVFKNKSEDVVNGPVAFSHVISNVQGQNNITANSLVDLTMVDAFEMIEKCFKQLEQIHYAPPTELFKTMFYYYLSPKELLFVKRFNKAALQMLLSTVTINYQRAIVAPGEMVGMTAGQSIGEVSTQMSLVSSEKVKIVSKNKTSGEIQHISTEIGAFVDSLMDRNPELTFNTGHNKDSYETIIDQMDNEYYTVGVTTSEQTQWNKISHVSRHPVNGDIMKITTKSGRVVETTTSHSHLVRDKLTQCVVPIVGANMTVGMRIPVAKRIDNAFVNSNIVVGEKEFKMDYLFGWFVGAYLAEGNINYYEIAITNVSQTFIDRTEQFARLFNKEIRIAEKQGEYGPSVTTKFVCKELALLLLDKCGTGSFVKRVPDFAFTAPDEFKSGLIQAYFDGDGNFNHDENHNTIRVCSRSCQLIKDVSLLLSNFGIVGTIRENFTKGSNMHNLYISAKSAIIYQEQIGTLLHKDSLDKIVGYLNRETLKTVPDYIDRINGLGEIIARCAKTLALPGQSRNYKYYAKKDIVGRRTLEKYYNVFNNHAKCADIKDDLSVLKQAVDATVLWDEIVGIQIYTPEQTTFVYDFTVPENQTFMTDYGIIVHNTLNTFHFAGVASKSNVTRGVPRIEEILSLSTEPKNPSLTIYLKDEDATQKDKAQTIMYMLEHTKMSEVVKTIEICFDPDDSKSRILEDQDTIDQFKVFENMIADSNNESGADMSNSCNVEQSKWILRMEMDPEVMLEKNITMDDVNFTLNYCFEEQVSCVYSDYNADKLIFRIRMNKLIEKSKKPKVNPLDQSDQIYLLKNFQEQLMENVVLRGIKGIDKVICRKIKDNVVEQNGIYTKQDIWVLDTVGTNMLDVLGLDYINESKTFSNDIVEIYNVLGIEAARQTIMNELVEVIAFDGTYINYHNYSVLVDRMTYTSKMISIFRHGINNDNIGPIAKASFEETPEMFLKAARHAELDSMRGVSANIMCGQEGLFGTNAFQVYLDIDQMQRLEEDSKYEPPTDANEEIDEFFGEVEKPDDDCAPAKLAVQNNVVTIKPSDMGGDNEYNPGF